MNSIARLAAAFTLVGLPQLGSATDLHLDLEEAIARALEHNLSVRVQRFEPQIAREAVRQAEGAYDPVLNSEYLYERSEFSGLSRDEESAFFRFGVGSTLPWGTRWEAVVEGSDRTTPLDLSVPGPDGSISSFAGLVVTQPLLRDFGPDGSYSRVRVARRTVDIAWEEFRARAMDVVTRTITAYQNLAFAQENLRIAEGTRDLARQLLRDNSKRVETGAMAPLDMVQAESEAALREVSVISARAFLQQARNALKALIWDDPETVLALHLEIRPPAEPRTFQTDPARDYRLALDFRPDYQALVAGHDIRQLELRELTRSALPQFDLVGSIGRQGTDRSLSRSFSSTLRDGDPAYSIGAVLSLPFPNRARSAEKVQAYLRRNQSELALQELEQTIRLELDDAATRLQADWDRIQAARTARGLALKSLQAEEKKLKAGTSSTFVVLRLQGDLANAEIREINALAEYAVSLARYHHSRGQILEVYQIHLRHHE